MRHTVKKMGFCPMCEADREVREARSHEEYVVCGEKIAIEVPRLICKVCFEAFVDDAFGDPTERVYAEYRRRHQILRPDQAK